MTGSRETALLLSFVLLLQEMRQVTGDCLRNEEFEQFFIDMHPANPTNFPMMSSCCMADICGMNCPEPVDSPALGFGIAVAFSIAATFGVGIVSSVLVKGSVENYFLAGRSLPLWITALSLGAQSIGSASMLGNVQASYASHFFDGACVPIGLGLSLIVNGKFLARKINAEKDCLTLPDVFSKRYGVLVEVLVSLASIFSFMMLLAANLSGVGRIAGYVWGIPEPYAIWLAAIVLWTYTALGGFFAVAYTDVAQVTMGWTGCVILLYYMLGLGASAPAPSIGFPGYTYPNEEVCDMYNGTPCSNNSTQCCYNSTQWCDETGESCRTDNGAHPIGDKVIFWDQMTNPFALSPGPNGVFWNWATIFVLTVGNLGALDFQVRCKAAKNSRAAAWGCYMGGILTLLVGIPMASLGSVTRMHYGPDSKHAEFVADSCSEILGLATCAQWLPDRLAFLKLLTHQAPKFLGAWCLVGLIAASMSTADGAVLAIGAVFSHNVVRHINTELLSDENVLVAARNASVPFALAATFIAAYNKSSVYLLVLAFDVSLATVVTPLLGCFYTKRPSPRAALLSVLSGGLMRIFLEVVLPKDGSFLMPHDSLEFVKYGSAASTGLRRDQDAAPENIWDPSVEMCAQEQFRDLSGIGAILAFIVSVATFVGTQYLEYTLERPLFHLPGMIGYEKNLEVDIWNKGKRGSKSSG